MIRILFVFLASSLVQADPSDLQGRYDAPKPAAPQAGNLPSDRYGAPRGKQVSASDDALFFGNKLPSFDLSGASNATKDLPQTTSSQRIVNVQPSHGSGPNLHSGYLPQEDVTITDEVTQDVFSTLTNYFYNTIPVTLTEFIKATVTASTVQVVTTSVDDNVYVAKVPYTQTDTITVTASVTSHQYVTEVSTDLYTVTHSAYDIQQQVITSTVMQTQVYRPTIVSTVIITTQDTSTAYNTVTNTVIVTASPHPVGYSNSNFLQSQVNSLVSQLLSRQEQVVRQASSLSRQLQSELSRRLGQQGLSIFSVDQLRSKLTSISSLGFDERLRLLSQEVDVQNTILRILSEVTSAQQGSFGGSEVPSLRYQQ